MMLMRWIIFHMKEGAITYSIEAKMTLKDFTESTRSKLTLFLEQGITSISIECTRKKLTKKQV